MLGVWRIVVAGVMLVAFAEAQPKRILYVTHSAGYRHDSIPVSVEALRAGGRVEIVATEDVGMLNAATLRGFDAVLFFTSGELPVTEQQKRDLLEFVRAGKGFGGVHSATDTFYTWREYGELIGARFNGHPWVQPVRLDVEDPEHPALAGLGTGFTMLDEIYQFREFSRDRVRVLMTLDAASVDLGAAGVNPGTEDFPLTWCRRYGEGRVFYSALGHFDSTWRDARFLGMMQEALLWLTGAVGGDAMPRPIRRPSFAAETIGNSASFEPRGTISPGSLISVYGAGLTPGGTLAAEAGQPVTKLAGTTVKVNGLRAPLLYASPTQVNAYVPLEARGAAISIEVATPEKATAQVAGADATPGIFAVTATREWAILWTTGLGAVEPSGEFQVTRLRPVVTVNGAGAAVLYSGLAPGWLGLYQVNVAMPAGTTFPAAMVFRLGGRENSLTLDPR
jgi:uncharacterized protein